MSIKTTKRMALGVIASLVFAPLVAVAPASAADTAVEQKAGSTTVVRSDIASSNAVITVATTATGTLAAGDITLGSFTKDGVSLGTQVPAGVSWDWADGATDVDGAATTEAAASDAVADVTAQIAATATDIVVVTIANTTAAGKYTFAVDSSAASTDPVTFTFYVSGAPSAIAFDKATYSAEASANAAAQISLKDSAGRPTFYKAGDSLTVTASATTATSSVVLIDSGNYGQSVANTGYVSTNLSGTAAGSFTFTATGTGGSASATLTVIAAPEGVESAALATGTLAIGHQTGTNTTDRTTAATATPNTSIFLPPTQTSVTYKLTSTDGTTAKSFKVAISQTSGVPFPGGVAAATTYVPATLDADGTGMTADFTVTTTSALVGTGYTLTITGGTNLVYTVLYQAPVAYDIDLVDTEASVLAALRLATTSQKVIVKDQFGSPFAGATINYETSVRNTVAVKSVASGADGTATISTTDAAASTVTTDDTLTASIVTSDIPGAGTLDDQAVTTIKYYADAAAITASTVALAVTQPTTPGTTATYATTITTSTTASVTADTNLTNGTDALKIADQIAIAATVSNAAATGVEGIPVSVSVSAGAFVLCSGTLGEVLVGAQTGAKTTCASYTTTSGAYNFQVGFTKAGTATVTVTSGSATKTFSIKVVAGAAGIVKAAASGSIVTATVTDLWGNPVSGQNVTFTAAGGAQLGGNFSTLVGVTATDGTAQVAVSTQISGTYVVTTAITGGDSAVAADATNGVPAGVASATASVTVAAPAEPEPVYEKPTLSFAKSGGRIILSGTAVDGEGDIIIYVKSVGKTGWVEKAKTLEVASPGDFNGSIRGFRNDKVIRVKQEGTGLFSNQIIVKANR